jgi:hypothetical protein
MIELIKEKSYNTKDQKISLFKQQILLDNNSKQKLIKFSSLVISSKYNEYELPIFIGLNNGNIACLKLSKQKTVKILYFIYTHI